MRRLSLLLLALLSALPASAEAASTRTLLTVEPEAKSAVAAAVRALALDVTPYKALPILLVRGDADAIRRAADLPGVLGAHRDRRIAFDAGRDQATTMAYGGEDPGPVWAAGHDGRGVTVAVVDSGVNGLHPDLERRVKANLKVLDPVRGLPQYVTCPVACNTDTTGGHGTHVAGIAVGDGTFSGGYYSGVAPGASVVGYGVGDTVEISYAVAAYDHILSHPELGIVAVNNSFGVPQTNGDQRLSYSDPIVVASRKLTEAGVSMVFSAGNSGTGSRGEPTPGASDCSTVPGPDARTRAVGPGLCRFSVYGSAPWNIAVAMARKDEKGGPQDQHLNFGSSRGDVVEQLSLDGLPVSYSPTLTAPGVNVRAARDPNGISQAAALASAEPRAFTDDVVDPLWEPMYHPLSGTSMAAPHVTGAIAVIQGVAREELGRLLSPAEVKTLLQRSARPMTGRDAFYDFPCGSVPFNALPCGGGGAGSGFPQTSGRAYETYQVGAGHLDVPAAISAVRALAG